MAGDGAGRVRTDGPRYLVDWLWVVVEVECSLCRRCGRYRLARLAEKHSAGIDLSALLRALAGRCGLNKPGVKPRQYEAQCGARYRVPAGGPLPDGAPAREARPGEAWPPKVRRLGYEGPPATIAHIRSRGVTHVGVHCYGVFQGNFCHHTATLVLDALGLSDDLPVAHITRTRRLRCLRCGGKAVSVSPHWPDTRGIHLGPDGRELPPPIPGVTPMPRDPAAPVTRAT